MVSITSYTRQKDFQFYLLRHDEIGLVLPEQHPLNLQLRQQGISTDDPVDISVCKEHAFLLTENNVVFTNTCRRYLRREDFTPTQVTISIQRTAPLVAKLNNLVAMGTEKDVIPYPGMVFQRLKDPLHYDRGLFHLRERELSAADLELISLIEKYKDLY